MLDYWIILCFHYKGQFNGEEAINSSSYSLILVSKHYWSLLKKYGYSRNQWKINSKWKKGCEQFKQKKYN